MTITQFYLNENQTSQHKKLNCEIFCNISVVAAPSVVVSVSIYVYVHLRTFVAIKTKRHLSKYLHKNDKSNRCSNRQLANIVIGIQMAIANEWREKKNSTKCCLHSDKIEARLQIRKKKESNTERNRLVELVNVKTND